MQSIGRVLVLFVAASVSTSSAFTAAPALVLRGNGLKGLPALAAQARRANVMSVSMQEQVDHF
jgi:hypothetical protein